VEVLNRSSALPTSNFEYLNKYYPQLAKLGSTAECYLYSDPNACIYKLGLLSETIVNAVFDIEKLSIPENKNTLATKIRILKKEGILPKIIDDILYALRIRRNDAVHAGLDSVENAKILLKMAYSLSNWFVEVYMDWQYKAEPFVMPEEIPATDYEKIIKEKEAQINALNEQIVQMQVVHEVNSTERKKQAETVSEGLDISEDETRFFIDEQLRRVGWTVDTKELRYSKGARPQKGVNQAIAEWPTDSKVSKTGYADYALFIGLQLVGIVEAKKAMLDIPSVIDYQCKDYSRCIKENDSKYCLAKCCKDFQVPFVFATNGRKYLKQIETKSGIWFLDLRDESNAPYALKGWISPEGIIEMLEQSKKEAEDTLSNMPYDFLQDSDGLNLRNYQLKAIEAVEQALADGKKTALLSMATGTGKTRTILGMIYRFLKSKRFKRILFLVDRTALGEQAQDVFQDVKLEDLMSLDQIYNINKLEDKDIDKTTKIQVATVQSMVKRIMYPEDETYPSVSDFDAIIVDEAHRGYILDREMSDEELLYRDQDDYVSKYRTVIEYFDAFKVALTATPALHTTDIFGKPVFNYSYREAVIDGFLVDYDAPHTIKTKLSEEGVHYKKGETLAIYNPVTGEIVNSAELEDELEFDVDKFNRDIVLPNFNKTVLSEISKDINPEGREKTLIYAVNDDHADMIVDILKKIYSKYGIDNDAVLKITGSVAGGNKKKIAEAIKRFKNEQYPNIVVTVDLLTTGIDVPEITKLVFMRRIKSRILFEQMLGRATRLCPEIGKTHFEIYDPVGVYDSLAPVNTMKPVVNNVTTTIEDLYKGLETFEDDAHIQNQLDLLFAKIQRKQKNLSKETLEKFQIKTEGKTPAQVVSESRFKSPKESREFMQKYKDAFILLDIKKKSAPRPKVYDDREDKLTEHKRDYINGKRPEDYIESFKEFIDDNINKIAALKTVCTKPKDLTRAELKELKLILDENQFNESLLNSAWKNLKNEDLAADIISFIRQQALGSPLVSHERRIKNAVAKIKLKHDFNKMQLDWLDRIEKSLLEETVLDKQILNSGAFRINGGFNAIDKRFGGKLQDIIDELNDYLYDYKEDIA